jgi:hypothetical protein
MLAEIWAALKPTAKERDRSKFGKAENNKQLPYGLFD